MSHETARILISNRFDAVWNAGALSAWKVERENQKFTQPKGEPWGRLTIRTADTEPLEVGNVNERTPFVIFFQVFIPEEKGTSAAYKARDILDGMKRQILRSNDGTVVVHIRPAQLVPGRDEGGFVGFNVTIPGYFDHYPAS
jgi:hypothetical protein